MDCNVPVLPNNQSIKKKLSSIKHTWAKKQIKVAKDSFDQAEQRITYHGKRTDHNSLRIYGEKLVLKEIKFDEEGRDRREEYIEIVETQCTAAYLANEFNKVFPRRSKLIQFLQVQKKKNSLFMNKFKKCELCAKSKFSYKFSQTFSSLRVILLTYNTLPKLMNFRVFLNYWDSESLN